MVKKNAQKETMGGRGYEKEESWDNLIEWRLKSSVMTNLIRNKQDLQQVPVSTV